MLREMGFWSRLDVDESNRRCTDGDAVVIAACDIAITNIITTIDIDWWVQQVCGSHDGGCCTSGLLRMLLTTLVSVRRVCGRQITITSGRLLWESNWVRAELGRRGDWAVGWSLGCGYRSGSSRRDDNFNTLHSAISAKRQLQKNLLKRKSWLKANKIQEDGENFVVESSRSQEEGISTNRWSNLAFSKAAYRRLPSRETHL